MDVQLTKTVLKALEREGVRYIVFGAVALNLLGLARATEDLDLFVEPDRANRRRSSDRAGAAEGRFVGEPGSRLLTRS
jgi:hypothetical protein